MTAQLRNARLIRADGAGVGPGRRAAVGRGRRAAVGPRPQPVRS
ncbi:hypothetical protein HMPREF0972_00301 [Actinomyces sp. oral taxon 848 str. F0332]|nr:hypothetical protein HMPREF0972_00301 [Actinomyces sp. oral taxon 848 str. F0332]